MATARTHARTHDTKRNDFPVGLTPQPPIYIYIYINMDITIFINIDNSNHMNINNNININKHIFTLRNAIDR